MSKEMKESIAKIIGSKFYIGFLTLCVVIVSAIFLYQMEGSGILGMRCVGGTSVLPLAGILRIVVKTKKDEKEAAADLEKMKEKHKYKLDKLKIKKGIFK